MFPNPIDFLLRRLHLAPSPPPPPMKPPSNPTLGVWPPPESQIVPAVDSWPPPQSKLPAEPVELPDLVRKGTVLRRVDYVRQARRSEWSDLCVSGGPRATFAVDIDDEHGKEVWTVDQAITTDAALVKIGDPVIVTFERRPCGSDYDRTTLKVDWSRVTR
jgi:hypothetical protein